MLRPLLVVLLLAAAPAVAGTAFVGAGEGTLARTEGAATACEEDVAVSFAYSGGSDAYLVAPGLCGAFPATWPLCVEGEGLRVACWSGDARLAVDLEGRLEAVREIDAYDGGGAYGGSRVVVTLVAGLVAAP